MDHHCSGYLIRRVRHAALTVFAALMAFMPGVSSANDFCPNIYDRGALRLNFNPAFMHIDSYQHPNGNSYDGLLVTSFYNVIKNDDPTGISNSAVGFFNRDLIGLIQGIGYRSPSWWDATRDTDILTDLEVSPAITTPLDFANKLDTNSGPDQQVWPNEAEKVPDGVLPFEAVVSPQGFHPTPQPGRLTLINLDDTNKQEYIIDQSPQITFAACKFEDDPAYNPDNRPRFYHVVQWADMNSDGYKDAITVRSGFKVSEAFCLHVPGDVVWFENPGASIDPNTEWVEHQVTGVDFPETAGGEDSRWSADISVDIADLENDGVVEIVAGLFFTSGAFGGFPAKDSAIEIYGAPVGASDWSGVNPDTNPPRIASLTGHTTNGPTFGVRLVDLNRDGKLDVLATNHQTDNCYPRTQTTVPGRVYALEQPASGDIFNDPWVQRTLKDNIRPNPTYTAPNNDPQGPGRLAPGKAQVFWPTPWDEHFNKPWILVGGDEASKVWLLRPESEDATNWNYESATIFDINDYYGENTSQSFSAPAPADGVSISTVGAPAWHYDRDWAWGAWAQIYIPVFEGRDIVMLTMRPSSWFPKVTCPEDTQIACPAY